MCEIENFQNKVSKITRTKFDSIFFNNITCPKKQQQNKIKKQIK